MRGLHLGKEREDVLGVRNERHVAQMRAHRLAAAAERDAHKILDVRDAHHVVGVFAIHRHARETRTAHELHDLVHRVGVLGHLHVNARHHDLARNCVAQVENLVNHALFLVEQGVLLRDHVFDLFLRDVLAVVGALDAQKRADAVRACLREPHEGLRQLAERTDGPRNRLGHALSVRKTDALGHELADHDGKIRDDERDDDRRGHRRYCGKGRDTERFHPRGKRLGKRVGRDGCGEEANERDGDLDGGQEVRGVGCEVECARGTFVALLGVMLERGALRGGKRHLGHRKVTVEQREQEGGNDGNEYAHRDEFEPPRLGTECGDAGAGPYAMRSH